MHDKITVSISRTTQTSISYRPATDGLNGIVEARFSTCDKMNTDCLHLQEIPLPDIHPPSRHHKQKHPNDCSELRHRCCRRNCRNVPICKPDGKDWQLCLRKKRRYLSNSSSLSSCLLYTVQLYLERGGNSDFHSVAYTSDHASWSEFVDMTPASSDGQRKLFQSCYQDLLSYTIKKSSFTYISLAYFPQSSGVANTLVTSILRSNAIKAINKMVSTKDEFCFN